MISNKYRKNIIVLYGADWCPDCRRSKNYLEENGIDFEYVNIEEDENAVKIVEEINGGLRSIPTIIFTDGTVLTEPNNQEIADQLGIVK